MLSPMSIHPNRAVTFPERSESVNPDRTADQSPSQRLGDLLAEAFDRLPVDPDDSNFARPNQGEFERDSDLFDPQSLQQQGRCGSKIG